MTYPLSSPVVEGQATEAAQYNNLRSDALYLGGDAAASGSLRDLLYSSSGVYSLVLEGKTTIKMPASASAPVGLMIGGGIYSISENVTLTVSNTTTPNAGRYTIYANGSAGTFSLSLSAGDLSRVIGTFCWDGSGIIPGTLHLSSENALYAALKQQLPVGGRLTLVAANPIPDTDINMGDNLYFVPYKGNRIGLYLFGSWEYFEFTSISIGKSGLTTGIPYDVFLSADSDGLKLSVSAWLSVGSRAAGTLAWVDGVRVSGSDHSKRYLGSFVLNSSGYFEDSKTGRLLWNENNRLHRALLSLLSTTKSQGTVHMNSWAPYYDEDAPQIRMLVPVADADFEIIGVGLSSPISENDRGYMRSAAIGICRDIVMTSPYTGNVSCVPVFTHTFGNGPDHLKVNNYDSAFQGVHDYTLAFWSNYSFYPVGTSLKSACGECPGLYGSIIG